MLASESQPAYLGSMTAVADASSHPRGLSIVKKGTKGTATQRSYCIRARSASAATWPKAGHCGLATTRSNAARASSLWPP